MADPVCGKCSTTLWHRDQFKRTTGFGTAAVGCDYCVPALPNDQQRQQTAVDDLLARVTAIEAKLPR